MSLPWILFFLLRVFSAQSGPVETVHSYPNPIDALSAAMTSEYAAASLSYKTDDGWSGWQELHMENEQDPSLTESNLIMFPGPVTAIKTRGEGIGELHPIRVSHAPVTYRVAATENVGTPKILTRKDWGADESLLIQKAATAPAPTTPTDAAGVGDNGTTGSASKREQDCLDAQLNYPAEFKVSPPVMRDKNGNALRWPWTYSNEIKLLVVHHTAQNLSADTRSGEERMRALYQYHASNRGWGDIGYHYVIGDDGQIYEGKAGGDFVVGGHAYCNNANTIGIAMMGNFDISKPPQAQMRALQWLLQTLADRYDVDVDRAVKQHGIQLPAIVGHKQLVSTDCPGEYVWRTLDQVRNNVSEGDVNKPVVFPNLRPEPDTPPAVLKPDPKPTRNTSPGFQALGATAIEGRPGGDIIIPVLFRADKTIKKGAKIGDLWRSRRDMVVQQERNGSYMTLRGIIASPVDLRADASTVVRLRVTLPVEKGIFTVKAGDLALTLTSSGRRARGAQVTSSYQGDVDMSVQGGRPSGPPAGGTPAPNDRNDSSSTTPATTINGPMIRIKLNDSTAFETVSLSTDGAARVNAAVFDGKSISLRKNGDTCEANEAGRSVKSAILKIRPDGESTTLTSWKKTTNTFRGTIECRVIDGQLILINELPLEQYMMGLAEEPDTEPREKQRAFAIAARTYAQWYLDDKNRKFPGKPYDGSDSPAEFQVYGGMVFEAQNPRWVRIVKETANQVLLFGGQVIKPPYFSSDDGRTRSPVEAGWGNFPFASIFASKPDPWCAGMQNRGHGVGMSGCGAKAQADEGKTGEEILKYYYPGTTVGTP